MKTEFLFPLVLSLLLFSREAQAQVLLYDDFSGNSVNASLWNVVLPFSQSQVTESGGYLTTTGRGTLETVAGFNSPYTISGAVILNNPYEHFEVVMRSDLQPGYQSTDGRFYYELTGVKVEFDADGNGQDISIEQFTPTSWDLLAQATFSVVVGQPYNFVVTDTGSQIDLAIDGTDLLSAETSYATGNQIAFCSREFSTTSSSLTDVTIVVMPEPTSLAMIGVGILSLVGMRKLK